MKTKLLYLCILLSACVNVPTPTPAFLTTPPKVISVFPIKPTIPEYTRKPIISAQGNDFIVSDEFLNNALKYKPYVDKIDDWKKLNDIK